MNHRNILNLHCVAFWIIRIKRGVIGGLIWLIGNNNPNNTKIKSTSAFISLYSSWFDLIWVFMFNPFQWMIIQYYELDYILLTSAVGLGRTIVFFFSITTPIPDLLLMIQNYSVINQTLYQQDNTTRVKGNSKSNDNINKKGNGSKRKLFSVTYKTQNTDVNDPCP